MIGETTGGADCLTYLRRGLTNNGTASGVSRWRAKCLRLGEVNAVDYFAHPAHMIRVTASD